MSRQKTYQQLNGVKVKLNKDVYLDLSFLDIRNIAMEEYWYHYIKLIYEESSNMCYIDKMSFIVHVKKSSFAYIAQDVAIRFDTSNYVQRPLPIHESKKK